MATREARSATTEAEEEASPTPDETPEEAGEAPPKEPAPPPVPPPVDFFALESGASDDDLQSAVERRIARIVDQDNSVAGYNLVFLYDDIIVTRSDANRIYRALAAVDRDRPILLVLKSPGGDIAAAYFIGKLCREHTTGRFEVAIPREAKSAATLTCCGADVIHMGSLSELGPIDPQFNRMPALAVKHSLEHLAEIASLHPNSGAMISDYLSKSLPVNVIGHLERAAGSAVQYAERLLANRSSPLDAKANAEIARRLVYDYKDHGFVIDAREAADIFGEAMVKADTPLYHVANQIYEELDVMAFVAGRRFNRRLAFTGGVSGGCIMRPRDD